MKVWTLEICKKEARKYSRKTEWIKGDINSYSAAYRHNWLDQCCKHMNLKPRRKRSQWTLESCIKSAQKFSYPQQWFLGNGPAYNFASKRGWLKKCCKHMTFKRKGNNYWTLARCLKEAKKHKTRSEWYSKSTGSYQAARKKGWIEDCCTHMVKIRKPSGYWSKENCIKEAKKYKTRGEWHLKSVSSYQVALSNNWLDVCGKHMPKGRKPNNYWTLARCKKEAKKYNTRTEFLKNSSGAYFRAYHNGWLDKCFK